MLIGSFLVAAAASTAWCLAMRSARGMAGIGLDYLTILGLVAATSLVRAAGGAGADVAEFGVVCAVGAAGGLVLLRWGLAHPWVDPRPTPTLVRAAFVVFVVALVLAGGALLLGVPNSLPWAITPELSVLFGCLFLGAAAYFAFGLVDPRWENAGGQLAGFLAYDLILIVPFVQRMPTIDEELRANLIAYTSVVVVSAVVGAYYVFVDRRTRLPHRMA
ncbi:MAG: hypothetical protein ACSLFN_13945 [Candidatus Limnocylindrales bacterium]